MPERIHSSCVCLGKIIIIIKKKKRHVCVGKEKALGVHFCVEMAMAKGNYELNQHECALSAANKGFFSLHPGPEVTYSG